MEDNHYIPLPDKLRESVAIDYDQEIVWVDRRLASNQHFLTWHDRNRSHGYSFKITPTDAGEVAKLRAAGKRERTAEDDADLAVRALAIDYIKEAAAYGASDIHIMMRGTHTDIQIVVKGHLRAFKSISQPEGEGIARSIYQGIAKVRDASYNPLEFQNAQIPGEDLPAGTNLTSIRVVRGPCYPQDKNGSFMTMRLQYGPNHSASASQKKLAPLHPPKGPDGVLRLRKMGFTEKQIEKIRMMMDAPNGIILYTGPTGSGKTTSMYEVLKETARTKPHRRLVTVEDPVEYPMDWGVQMAVTGAKNDKETGAAFGERVRVALRMAPHIILLGELRGPEVSIAALEAAVTGHQVISTMHVTDPFLFVERLEIMDRDRLDRRVFCDHKVVRGVVAQRLLPRLCPTCSIALKDKPTALPKRMIEALETWAPNKDISKVRLQGPGCESCGGDGTKDRFAVAEIVVTTAALMSDFIKHGSETARANYRATPDADPSMLESAINHALKGLLDPRSIEDNIDLIEKKESISTKPRLAEVRTANFDRQPEQAASQVV